MKRKMETKAPVKRYQGLNRDYWLYWFASSLGMGASNILQYVLSLYVLEMTGSATLFASMLSIIIFPRILLTPLAGVLADRTRKIRLMSLILLGEAVLLAVYFRLGQTFTMGILWIYALVILLEIGEVFYGGCSSAILPELVPAEKLEDAISISKVDDGIVRVIAPMAAALIYDNMSIASAFAVIGMLNFLSFVLQRLIHPKYENQHPASVQRPSVWESFIWAESSMWRSAQRKSSPRCAQANRQSEIGWLASNPSAFWCMIPVRVRCIPSAVPVWRMSW